MPRKPVPCISCGVEKSPSGTSAPASAYRCNPCRSKKRGCEGHYRTGCRCLMCRGWNAARARGYRAVRAAAGKPLPSGDRWIGDAERERIYLRDAGVCQLCFKPVDFAVHYMDSQAPTLDHILPRSHGGSDAPENLRLACRGCNSARSDRLDWVPAHELV
ncbi:MAG: HNH endonuclease [Leucobacter sp.]